MNLNEADLMRFGHPGISDLEPWLASLAAELVGRIREVGTLVDSRGRSA